MATNPRTNPDIIRGLATTKWQPLYDSWRFLTVDVAEVQLFKQGIGGGNSAYFPGTSKRLIDTNLDANGKLTNNQSMLVKAMRAKYVFPSATAQLESNAADLDKLLFGAELVIEIGGAVRWKGQLRDVPSGIGQAGMAATTNATKQVVSTSWGAPDPRAIYLFYEKTFTITPDQSVVVYVRFGTAPTLTNSVIMTFQFEGETTGDVVG